MNRAELKGKLGFNVFKEDSQFHVRIKPGMETDSRLRKVIRICPAGLYNLNEQGVVELGRDGCLECGTCLLVCGSGVLDWNYPSGGKGVQFRFG